MCTFTTYVKTHFSLVDRRLHDRLYRVATENLSKTTQTKEAERSGLGTLKRTLALYGLPLSSQRWTRHRW